MARPRKLPGELADIVPKRTKEGRFRARVIIWDATGVRHEIEATAKTSEAAEAKVREKVRAVWKSDIYTITRDSTFEQLARDYLADMEQRPEDGPGALREASKKNYRRWTNDLIESYRDVRVHQITPVYLKRQIDMIRQTESLSASENATKAFSMIMSHAVFVGAAESNPVAPLRNKLVKSVPKKIALTPAQFSDIIDLVRAWRGRNPGRKGGARPQVQVLEDYLVLALATSARPSELLAFSLDDVIIDNGEYKLMLRAKIERVKNSDPAGPKTKLMRVERLKHDEQQRVIKVADFAVPTLQRLISEYREQEQRLLFSSKHGKPYEAGYIDKMMVAFRTQHHDTLKSIGITDVDLLAPYAMRKTAATVIGDRAGAALAAKFLGHKQTSTTVGTYMTHLPEVAAEATDALSAMFSIRAR